MCTPQLSPSLCGNSCLKAMVQDDTHTVRWQIVPEGISNTNRRPLHSVVRLCCTNYSHTHCCMASSSTHVLAAGQTTLYSVCLPQGGHTPYLSCSQISECLQNLIFYFLFWHDASQMGNSTEWWEGSAMYSCYVLFKVARSVVGVVNLLMPWHLGCRNICLPPLWVFGVFWDETEGKHSPWPGNLVLLCITLFSAVITVTPSLITHREHCMSCALWCKDIVIVKRASIFWNLEKSKIHNMDKGFSTCS